MAIRSWWGIGFPSYDNINRIVFDTRSGNIIAGTITASLNGNAATATSLQTTRAINGTNFNGSGNITTANWGTARNFTIGNTTRSVNGSGNYSWSVADIGSGFSEMTVYATAGTYTWTAPPTTTRAKVTAVGGGGGGGGYTPGGRGGGGWWGGWHSILY